MGYFDLHKHKCHICGKKFEARSIYVYKDVDYMKTLWFCSYSHMREYQRTTVKIVRDKKSVEEIVVPLIKEGLSNKEISKRLGVSFPTISKYRKKLKDKSPLQAIG